MRWSKTCPCCNRQKIFRRESRTCGAPECLERWREMTLQERMGAEETAGMSLEERVEIVNQRIKSERPSGK